jgi:hypothetical protein
MPTGRISVLAENEINDDHPTEAQVREEAREPADEDEDGDEHDSTLPGCKDD